MANLIKILLVEDDPNDVELTLSALTENHIAGDDEEAWITSFAGDLTGRERPASRRSCC